MQDFILRKLKNLQKVKKDELQVEKAFIYKKKKTYITNYVFKIFYI